MAAPLLSCVGAKPAAVGPFTLCLAERTALPANAEDAGERVLGRPGQEPSVIGHPGAHSPPPPAGHRGGRLGATRAFTEDSSEKAHNPLTVRRCEGPTVNTGEVGENEEKSPHYFG